MVLWLVVVSVCTTITGWHITSPACQSPTYWPGGLYNTSYRMLLDIALSSTLSYNTIWVFYISPFCPSSTLYFNWNIVRWHVYWCNNLARVLFQNIYTEHQMQSVQKHSPVYFSIWWNFEPDYGEFPRDITQPPPSDHMRLAEMVSSHSKASKTMFSTFNIPPVAVCILLNP